MHGPSWRKNIQPRIPVTGPIWGARGKKKKALPKRLFPEEARCPLFGLRSLRVCLLEMLVLLLHHDVKLFLLVVIQRATHLADGAFADGVDLLDLVVARHGAV